MKKIVAREGLVAIPYECKQSIYSRLYQVIKLYLFAPSSGLVSCPLAMTDGAAKTLQVKFVKKTLKIQIILIRLLYHLLQNKEDSFAQEAYSRLISRDCEIAWFSGQWMTERKGGSDVAQGTETVAVEQDDNTYKLYGYKWFSSATDADVTLTLGRCKSSDQESASKKLTMFLARVRNKNDKQLNGIEIHKLKDKLGTRFFI